MVRTNNRADPKVCQRFSNKTNLGKYFDDPILPTGSLRYSAFTYIAASRLDYCTQEVVLFQRAAKYGLHNSVKLSQCSLELDFETS